ncbi:MAG: glycosyltransferase [Bacteroidota bacterium]
MPSAKAFPRIAVIVPYRNELPNLPALLAALAGQDYPTFEVILVDDGSTDGGPAYVDNSLGAGAGAKSVKGSVATFHHLSLEADVELIAHKKAALTLGITHAEAELILTTDADCTFPPDWLRTVAAGFTPGVEVLSGPVLNHPLAGFVHHFQALDLAAYQFLTATSIAAGSPTLANGAFFAFRKQTFYRVGGYAGVDHLPSGDDVLLLHKFRQSLPPEAFKWLTGPTVVRTRPVDGWPALWRQRLRWAGKAGHYQAPELELAQALTFAASLSLLVLLSFTWHPRTGAPLLLAVALKFGVDYYCLRAFAYYYRTKNLLRWYFPTAVVYPLFLVTVGVAALLGFRTDWKGRSLA